MRTLTRLKSSIKWKLPATVCGLLLLVTAAKLSAVTAQLVAQMAPRQQHTKTQLHHLAAGLPVLGYFKAVSPSAKALAWQGAAALLRADTALVALESGIPAAAGSSRAIPTVFLSFPQPHSANCKSTLPPTRRQSDA